MVRPPNKSTYAVLNPAIGFCNPLASLFLGETEPMKWFWIYLCFPFAGAILAVLFHELVYKRIHENIEEIEQNDDGILDI